MVGSPPAAIFSGTTAEVELSAGDIAGAAEMLRQFDMSLRYGPCIGISRMRRWRRAERFALGPPRAVLDILRDPRYRQAIPDIEENLWIQEC